MNEARAPRATLHLARPEDAQAEVRRLKGESDSHFAKRCASIRALGVLYVNHPGYVFDPRHSVHAEVWLPAHRLWWEQVHASAALTRAKSKAFQRSQDVINAMGSK